MCVCVCVCVDDYLRPVTSAGYDGRRGSKNSIRDVPLAPRRFNENHHRWKYAAHWTGCRVNC